MNEHKAYEGYPAYEVKEAFADIEKSEDKRSQFNMEAEAIHKKTVEAWDRLFSAIAEITRKYEDSPALLDSKMRQYLPEVRAAKSTDIKPVIYVDGRIER